MSAGGWVCAVRAAPGFALGVGVAAGWGHGEATGLAGCLAVVLGGGRVLRRRVAADWGFRVSRRPAWPVARCEAAGAWAVAGAPAVGMGLVARLGDAARDLGRGVLDEGVVVEVDEVVVMVEVVASEADETDVGDKGGSRPE